MFPSWFHGIEMVVVPRREPHKAEGERGTLRDGWGLLFPVVCEHVPKTFTVVKKSPIGKIYADTLHLSFNLTPR